MSIDPFIIVCAWSGALAYGVTYGLRRLWLLFGWRQS